LVEAERHVEGSDHQNLVFVSAMSSFLSSFFSDQAKTFRPKAAHKTQGRCKLHDVCKATLGVGDMRAAVKLPAGEDLNEWLAVNTVDFFNEISLLFGVVSEFCQADSCPLMTCGARFEYLWADGVKVKKPVQLSAPAYIANVMEWVEQQLNDRALFPLEPNESFPKDFAKRVANIFKRIFRIYGHIYCHHLPQVVLLGAEAHLNTCFRHFILFVQEFQLIEEAEQEPLKDVIASFTLQK
jgi:MOB kinase activator 1